MKQTSGTQQMKDKTSTLMAIAPRPDTLFTDGSGSWLKDSEGQRYLDFVQGWTVNTLGNFLEFWDRHGGILGQALFEGRKHNPQL